MFAKNYLNLSEIALVLVIGIILITMAANGFVVLINPVAAQSSNSGNMTAPMMGSASFHLKVADELLANGDTAAALDQINLAEIQLSLLNMDSQGTTMNQTQAMEFVVGGSLSSPRMAANCIINNEAMVICMQ